MDTGTLAFNQKIGQLLRKLRTENCMTQDELAKLTSLSRASIANMETGRQAMSAYQAYVVARALKLKHLDALFPLPEIETDSSQIQLNSSSELNDIQRRQAEAVIANSTA